MRMLALGRATLSLATALTATAAFAAGSSPQPTPIALTLAQYTQNFDTLSNSTTSNVLPLGWQIVESGTATAADGSYAVGTGSSTTGTAYSFGSAGSTDRALGSLTSSTATPIYLGAYFTNTTGSTIASLTINFTGEQWRRGNSSSVDQLTFGYLLNALPTTSTLDQGSWTAVSGLDFVSPQAGAAGATDGNATGFNTPISATISGLSIANGQSFAIRWVDTDVPANDDGLAIDNFGISAITGAVPESSTWAMMLAGFGATGFALRRRRSIALA